MENVKNIITDVEQIGEYSETIDPRKEGKLLQEIVLALKNTMREKDLISLSAPQIGYNKRVFCIRFGKSDYRTFVNPLIDRTENFQFMREQCSSIPDKRFIRPRFGKIHLMFTTPLGKIEATTLEGFSAQKVQHCVDHLDGLLLSDVALEIDDMFDNATSDEQAEVLKMYAESLDIRQKEIEKEIAEDEELKQMDDAIKFMEGVQSGKVSIENIKDK